ncbi:Glycoside hydrolase, family 25 [Cordyceps fumosorosea ARSEF 2679]|uniref:Glycoside hydrolase, family 25 n=1 Tax=Cordyceps fumosorosea (strain ARSEF 2679) TaxID=1081104 RepID=A0A167RM25_CORFA|nr:Glycoside hydrolase, family 25 [Cordyceps fumosorosea ARSEF 2679]OAA58728.1 Glycoside hydrolase, family 25 [Cordyceps fumosorosea ARSEF 2679]
MRFLTVLATLCTAVSAIPTTAEVQTKAIVELWRAYSGSAGDHFYTTDYSEYNNAVTRLGYSAEGVAAKIYSYQVPNSIPLYRTWSPGASDHFYTTSAPERDNAVQHLGYVDEGITGYVFATDKVGGLPARLVEFYRAYSPGQRDHFYTTSGPEVDNAVRNLGYTYEGVACYVFQATK